MNAARLLALYERIADAPDAIARLRRFVLDLAVRGKLVPQDVRDEAAPFDARPNAQATTPLPDHWRYVRLGDLLCEETRNGYSRRPDDAADGVPILRISAGTVRHDGVVAEEEHKRIGAIDVRTREDYGLRPGDLLACRFNGNKAFVGRLTIFIDYLGLNPIYPDKLIRVRANRLLVAPSFLRLASETNLVRADVESFCATTVGNWGISASNLKQVRFPVPPLAEQHRIVAKVDELMALCDRLEAARVEREGARDRLTAATLARLNTPNLETFPADARFTLNTLPALTTRPDQIKPLRQSILNLAVRGKLVPQDPNDEPASVLLNRISRERGTEQGTDPLNGEPPFEAPAGWQWLTLGRLVLGSDAGWSPKTADHPRRTDNWGVLKVSAVSWDYFRPEENKEVLPGTEPRLKARVGCGDFLISRANTAELVARAVIVDTEPTNLMMSDKIVRLQLSPHCDPRFVWLVNNNADHARAHYARHASGVSPSMKNVSRDVIMALPFPLPPLAEQHRIVAKVNALMALCDALEQSLTAATTARTRLLEATLAEALAPATGRVMDAVA